MKTFETRRKLRTQRDISARQHDRVSRDLEAAQTRIDELGKEVKEAWTVAGAWKDQHDRILDELKKARTFGKTAAAGRDQATALAGEYAKILEDTYGYTPPTIGDWTEEQQDDERPDEHVEEFPAMFMEVANKHKAEHPEVEGKTTSWHKLTPEQEQELRKDLPPVEAWDAFTTSSPLVPVEKKPRRRVPAARKPSGQS